MKMNNYIAKIMTEVSFKSETLAFEYDDRGIEVALYTKDRRAFLVISVGEKDASVLTEFTNKFQGQLFDWALKEFSTFTKEMTKNTYLLLLVEEILAKDFEKKVFINIEEDAFFFKKYVLSYSQSELEILSSKTTEEGIIDSLGDLAVNQAVFEKFSKKGQELEGFERLLYQLFIKVPVVSLPTKAQEIESLEKVIEAELKKRDSDSEHKFLLESLENISEAKIDLKLFKDIVGKL